MIIAKMLKLYMASEDITCDEMASVLYVSSATISRITCGHTCDAKVMLKLIVWLFSKGGESERVEND